MVRWDVYAFLLRLWSSTSPTVRLVRAVASISGLKFPGTAPFHFMYGGYLWQNLESSEYLEAFHTAEHDGVENRRPKFRGIARGRQVQAQFVQQS